MDKQGCAWVWLGDVWDRVSDTCPDHCGCDEPGRHGNYLGEPEFTACNCP